MRDSHSKPPLRRSQIALRYPAEILTAEEVQLLPLRDPSAQFYMSMFVQDVALWIMPISAHRSHTAQAILVDADKAAEKLVIRGLRDEHYGHDLWDALYQFVHRCAGTIAAYGYAAYELVLLYPQESEKAVGFELFGIWPATLRVQDDALVQYVPERLRQDGKYPPALAFPADRLIIFELPAALQQSFIQGLGSLMAVNLSRGADLAVESFRLGQHAVPYDFRAHKAAEHLALAEGTRGIGWDARGLFQEAQLDYYRVYRQLVFMKFVAQLREAIISTLNSVLTAVSQLVSPVGQIAVQGLPTSADMEAMLQRLERGDVSFKEAIEFATGR